MKKLSKILSVGLSLTLCAALVMPSFAAVALNKDLHIDGDGYLKENEEENYDYYLDQDIELDQTLKIKEGVTASLDLKGHDLMLNDTVETEYDENGYLKSLTVSDQDGMKRGSVVKIEEQATLTLDDSTGHLEQKKDEEGNLVKDEDGNPVMEYVSGAITGGTGNEVIKPGKFNYGGGVYNEGTFTMTGGTITGNTLSRGSNAGGGGVFSSGTFNMTGGAITGNTTDINDSGGGVYNKGTFTMTGGTITGNTAAYSAGGVYNLGTFNMEDGTITGNKTGVSAGGVYNSGTFNMENGAITDNDAWQAGGVYNSGTFNMEDGTIKGNTVTWYGGGVCGDWGTFNMKGGTIAGNTATYGGGVWISGRSSGYEGTFNMTYGTITDNTASAEGDEIYTKSYAILNLPEDLLWDQDNESDRENGVEKVYGAEDLDAITKTGLKFHEHNFTDVETVEPTCTEAGKTVHSGCYCERTVTVAIDALGHTPGDPVEENRVEPQVGAAGSYDEVVYCTVCDEELSRETKILAALPVPNPGGGTPTNPTDPTNPTNPTDPTDPTNPTDPTDPTVEVDEPDVPLAERPEAADEAVEIDGPEVPLGERPEAADETVEIDGPDVPLSDVPQTGEASTVLWLAGLLAAGMGLVYLNTGKRKENA